MVSAIIIGKPDSRTHGRISFSAEVVKYFTPLEQDKVTFNSKQFFLVEPPQEGNFDVFIVQRGEIDKFNNYFKTKKHDADCVSRINHYCDLLSSCSQKLYSEKENVSKTITDYILNFLSSRKSDKYKLSYDEKNDLIDIGGINKVEFKSAIPYSSSLDAVIQKENKNSIIHFSLPANQDGKSYLIATEYEVIHNHHKIKYPKDCSKNGGFLKIGGYSPMNIFQHLSDHLNDTSDYFTGEMKNYFQTVSNLIKDKRASGNICKAYNTSHFIIINDESIVSNSSAAHHIPDAGKNLHIIAPGNSDNFEFEMLFYNDDGVCPTKILPETTKQKLIKLQEEASKIVNDTLIQTKSDLAHGRES